MKNKTIGAYVAPKPEAWVAVSNNRQKIYGTKENLVYLDNGQEFQIELYNPTTISYLAKIYLNDKLISNSGLVLKPGQRYFLDRHIDEQKKLLFSTYEVEDTEEVKRAIENNGKVKVEFYAEQTNPISISTGTYTWITTPGTWSIQPYYYGGSNLVGDQTYFTNSVGVTDSGTISGNGITSTNTSYSSDLSGSLESKKSIETGRIESGEKSNQSFGTDHGTYSFYCSYISEYQILPRSTKPVEVTEIRSYCTSCGSRIKKKTWKFCPNCGESLD